MPYPVCLPLQNCIQKSAMLAVIILFKTFSLLSVNPFYLRYSPYPHPPNPDSILLFSPEATFHIRTEEHSTHTALHQFLLHLQMSRIQPAAILYTRQRNIQHLILIDQNPREGDFCLMEFSETKMFRSIKACTSLERM